MSAALNWVGAIPLLPHAGSVASEPGRYGLSKTSGRSNPCYRSAILNSVRASSVLSEGEGSRCCTAWGDHVRAGRDLR